MLSILLWALFVMVTQWSSEDCRIEGGGDGQLNRDWQNEFIASS